MRDKLEKLDRLGWKADDELSLDLADLAEDLEVIVHELAHNLIVGGLKELHKPKTSNETSKLVKTRKHQNKDELLTTAVTVLVCQHFGVDVSFEAYSSAAGNITEGTGKYDAPNISRFSKDRVKIVETLIDELAQTSQAEKLAYQLVSFLEAL